MSLDPLLRRLSSDLSPEEAQKDRIKARILQRMDVPAVLRQAKEEANPTPAVQQQMWQKVLNQIELPVVSTVFDRLRSLLSPTEDVQSLIKTALFQRLSPMPVRATSHGFYVKWVAAFALVLVALRASPVLFLAPQTIAQSTVMLIPTKGSVALSLHGLWQPLSEETEVRESVQLQTTDGEATILLHDDGTVRLAPHTIVTLHDLSDRPEPSLNGPTLTVTQGAVWVQGLLPSHVRGITIATPDGEIMIRSGSVSIAVDDATGVRAWDRHSTVTVDDTETVLLAGERTTLQGEDIRVRSIDNAEYSDEWVTQNLQRDAVHQREVAQMQQERRAAQAGILPTSPLYTMKRVAERVDVLFTLNPETKVQKQLAQASTRLDEAAALISEGFTGALVPLEDYKRAIISIASGTGGDSVTQFLLRQEIAENTAELSAALPDDAVYQLKRAVLEASADLTVGMVDVQDVEGVLIIDALAVMHNSIASGDIEQAEKAYATLQPYLATLDENDDLLKPDVRKEVVSLLSDAAAKLHITSGTGNTTSGLADALEPYAPPAAPVHVPLTEQEMDLVVAGIVDRINTYSLPRSQWNQLHHELGLLMNHPDAGSIFRRLYRALPNELARYVRTAIQELRNMNEQ